MKKLLITILFLLVAFPASAAYYVNDPTSCLSLDPTNYPGQDCTPDNICGVVSGIVQCYDNSTLNPPTASTTSNTLYSGSYGGGFIMDCYRATTCNYGYCNRDATCYTTKRRDTTCVPNVWETAVCGDCRSGYLDCASDDVCEVQIGSTAWSTPHTTYLTCSTGQCASGYQACNGDTATADGCNYQTGVTSCTTGGGEPGTIGASCTCVALPQENFITNTLASAWGNFLLYAEQLNPTGWLINLYNDVTGAFFRVDQDGNASTTGSMTANSYCINTSSPDCITAWPTGGSGENFFTDDGTTITTVTSTRNFLIGGTTTLGNLLAVNATDTTSKYIDITLLDLTGSDLGDVGYYPLLAGHSDGAFGTAGPILVTADAISVYDTTDDDITSINFVGNNVSSIGQMEYDNQTYTFDFKDLLGNSNVNITGGLNVDGNATTASLSIGSLDGLLWGTGGVVSAVSTSSLGLLSVETDPIWTATSSNYLTVLDASNTYQLIGDYLTTSTGLTVANFATDTISQWYNDAGYITSTALSGYVPYTGATTNVDLGANQLTVGGITNLGNTLYVAATDTADVYWTVSLADFTGSALGDMGYYPLLSAVSNGALANIGAIANNLVVWHQDESYNLGIALASNDLSSIGQINYTTSTDTFTFTELIGSVANIDLTGNLSVGGNATTTGIQYVGDGIYMPTKKALYSGVQVLAYGDTANRSYFFGGAGNTTLTGDYNIGMGEHVLSLLTDGTYNIAIGDDSMSSSTGADYNIAIGGNALKSALNSQYNVAVGVSALQNQTNASYNTAIGQSSMSLNVDGQNNTSVGAASGQNGSGDNNVSVGYFAGNGTAGSDNSNNVSIGYTSGWNLTTGSNNVFLGYQAGDSISNGSNNILIGYGADAPASSTSNYLSVGDLYLGDIDLKVATIDGDLNISGNVEATGYVTGRPSRKSPISMSTEFMTNQGNTFGEWLGSVYGSGTLGSTGEDDHPGVAVLYDSTTAGGGYYIYTTSVGIDLSGYESTEFVFQINQTAKTNCRFGFLDDFLDASSTDGLHFAMLGTSTLRAYACSNSTCTEASSTYTITTNTWYSGVIETNSDATEATFTLYNEAGTSLWSETITSNVPTGATRKVGHGVSCFESTTGAAAPLMSLDYMNLYFNRSFVR